MGVLPGAPFRLRPALGFREQRHVGQGGEVRHDQRPVLRLHHAGITVVDRPIDQRPRPGPRLAVVVRRHRIRAAERADMRLAPAGPDDDQPPRRLPANRRPAAVIFRLLADDFRLNRDQLRSAPRAVRARGRAAAARAACETKRRREVFIGVPRCMPRGFPGEPELTPRPTAVSRIARAAPLFCCRFGPPR